MKKIISSILIIGLLLNTALLSTSGKELVNGKTFATSESKFVDGEFIVGFKDDISSITKKTLIQKNSGVIINENEVLNIALVRVEKDKNSFVQSLSKEDSIRFVEPNFIGYSCYIPNDEGWDEQWGPQAIKCPEAWDIEKGNLGVSIAIVDSGISPHIDLTHYFGEGYDWQHNDNDPTEDDAPYGGHGTCSAGIAAATMNNSLGIAGVSQVTITAEDIGNGTVMPAYEAACGIQHATDIGADVISMSFGYYNYSEALEDACQYAWNNGVVLVASAGNYHGETIAYPGKFDTVICVGAIDQNNQRCNFSNYGPEMDLVAPGTHIVTTGSDFQFPGQIVYVYFSGTSAATAFVTGVVALLLSRNPLLSNTEVRSILNSTADDLGSSGWDEEYGYGRVNASAAVQAVDQVQDTRPEKPNISGPTGGEVGGEYTYNASTVDPNGDMVKYCFEWGDGPNISWTNFTASGETVTATHVFERRGLYTIRVKAEDELGFKSERSDPLTIFIGTNAAPDTPKVSGPTHGKPRIEYLFSTNTTDLDGDPIYCLWDWGDGSYSNWLGPYYPGETAPASHTWVNKGNYTILVKAKDIFGAESEWSEPLSVAINSSAPLPPEIHGPTKGKNHRSYNYSFTTTDPDGDNVSYWIFWGDVTPYTLYGPYGSGEEVILNHTFNITRPIIILTIEIKAQAKDTDGLESNWTTLKVTIPRTISFNSLFMKFLERFLHAFPILRGL
ncbi:MAG: S8 family serine peptidase [Euryarchaeota archaeon]|nr:S8 family serine peptidase [Euryarchaeota archaeon]